MICSDCGVEVESMTKMIEHGDQETDCLRRRIIVLENEIASIRTRLVI